VDGRIIVNDTDLAVRAAVDGLGIAYTIETLADPFLRSGQLVRVLEDWCPPSTGSSSTILATGKYRSRCAPSSTCSAALVGRCRPKACSSTPSRPSERAEAEHAFGRSLVPHLVVHGNDPLPG
jgi:hypothetical protein